MAWGGLGILLLVVSGCGPGARGVRGEPLEEGVRTKGGSSATARLPVLLARGEWAEAEALIVALARAGQLAREEEERLREELRRSKEQRPGPGRAPFPVSPSDSGEDGPSCGTELPAHPLCAELPEAYSFASPRLALEAMKQRLGQKNLTLHKDEASNRGPCPLTGRHLNVRLNGKRMGSITCCQCCVDMADGPLEWEKCRIVW
jgi:hypothetical protein